MSDYKHKVFIAERDGLTIRGIYYMPEGEGPFPLAIISQGFRSDKFDNEEMAIIFARNGFAALIFDFCGGTLQSKSDGFFLDMTPLTEVADLQAILKEAAKSPWNFTDIFLVGISLGGMVSSIVADRNPELVKGLMLLYPAFVAPDDARRMFPSKDDVPGQIPVMGELVGRKYFQDIYDMDVFDEIKDYPGPVLIIHGVEDEIVPIEYSRKAKQVFKTAVLKEIPNEGHGFGHEAYLASIVDCMRFMDLIREGIV